MPINGVTSQLPDPAYIAALEAELAELRRLITNQAASIRSTQSR